MISLGLIGYPLKHSLSPILHMAAMRALGMDGEYKLFSIEPSQEREARMAEIFLSLRLEDLLGVNVTIPYKQTVVPYLDGLTARARSIGAVNTIYRSAGRLLGENTDAHGFIADLRRFAHSRGVDFPQSVAPDDRRPLKALILGAGGAARAVIFALLQEGWQILVSARRVEQAEWVAGQMNRSIGSDRVKAISLEEDLIREYCFDLELIVNATPVGMSPYTAETPWPKSLPFPEDCLVYDLVYNPIRTAFVCAALQSGLEATTGIGMLVEQAALSFELWTGQPAPRAAMFAALPSEYLEIG